MNKVIRVIDNHYYVNLISVDTLFQKNGAATTHARI